MVSLGSGWDQLASRRDQLRIEVILPGSAEDRRERRRAAGVVVELLILPVPLRRAAEVVVELRGRREGVAAPPLSVEPPKTSLRCRGRCRAVVDPRRAAVDVVGLQLV